MPISIPSRTIASLEHAWAQERDLLTSKDVLVIDEAGMIGSRQLERVLSEAEARGAKVVMVGDPEQLQSIEAGAAFRSVAGRHGAVEITDIRRQHDDWQRDATRHLATGRTAEAIGAYAATIHKSQGVTVDRTLSRDRAKDMASDYGREESRDGKIEQRFAERRGISFRERVRDMGRAVTDKVRGIFDGFRPTDKQPAPELDVGIARRDALVRHARAITVIFAMNDQGMDWTPEQLGELKAARGDLNALRGNAALDIEAAYKRDPDLAHEAASGNPGRARDAMWTCSALVPVT